MLNLLNKTVVISPFLKHDPFKKAGKQGKIIKLEIFDEENIDFHIQFNDGIIAKFQNDNFTIKD